MAEFAQFVCVFVCVSWLFVPHKNENMGFILHEGGKSFLVNYSFKKCLQVLLPRHVLWFCACIWGMLVCFLAVVQIRPVSTSSQNIKSGKSSLPKQSITTAQTAWPHVCTSVCNDRRAYFTLPQGYFTPNHPSSSRENLVSVAPSRHQKETYCHCPTVQMPPILALMGHFRKAN